MEYTRRNTLAVQLAEPASGKRILDVGCDWGYACMRAAQAGAEAWGVDIDPNSVHFGRQLAAANRLNVNLQYGNVRSLPFPDEHFDAITAIEVIEHVPLPDRSTAFAEMSRVLKPGGRIVITTPNPNGLAELGKRLLGRSAFMRRRFYGSYHDELRTKVFPAGDVMVDVLVTGRELLIYATQAGLTMQKSLKIVFVTKFLPEWFLFPARLAEWLLERMPVARQLASTTVYVLAKQRQPLQQGVA